LAAEAWDVPRWYTDWRELLLDSDIDAVCIATPTGTHAEIALAAAEAGKHVLVEKPMASTTSEADRMIRAFRDARRQLGVIFMYRFLEPVLKMRTAISQGVIGTPILGECSVKSFRDQAYYDSGEWRGSWKGEGGGSLMTQASHTIDLLIWMLGDVAQVTGYWVTTAMHRIEVDDLAVAALRFQSGALGVIVSSTAISPPAERSLTIHGELGTIGLVGDELAIWQVPGGPDEEAARLLAAAPVERGDTAGTPYFTDWALHFKEIEDFVAAIQEDRAPIIDGVEGRRAVATIEAIYASEAQNRAIRPA